jgi:hypothetical protein
MAVFEREYMKHGCLSKLVKIQDVWKRTGSQRLDNIAALGDLCLAEASTWMRSEWISFTQLSVT